ncbi:hypothetical protein RM780_04015 [Streptomyces sp. DSM 44917]|uniref:HK97 gp10 family phage protein n=1 Tax=Streptomyces boetiae TaxID=3075541 RepID=A0ABU2L4G5_9ACTN|nr:hypothetical protein [Streptomyces sp. DSM 44917]MDT0306128.1 hypothetical protein [Streptomyces sp. DSM 44917]
MDWHGDEVRRAIRDAAARGLQHGAEHVLGESNTVVPLDEAALQRSGVATVDDRDLRAAVSYDTPYAVPQHERLDYEHAPGRKAKFLEDALNENRAEVADLVAAQIRRALR